MGETRLRWFGHIYHMSDEAVLRRTNMVMGKGNTKERVDQN